MQRGYLAGRPDNSLRQVDKGSRPIGVRSLTALAHAGPMLLRARGGKQIASPTQHSPPIAHASRTDGQTVTRANGHWIPEIRHWQEGPTRQSATRWDVTLGGQKAEGAASTGAFSLPDAFYRTVLGLADICVRCLSEETETPGGVLITRRTGLPTTTSSFLLATIWVIFFCRIEQSSNESVWLLDRSWSSTESM